MGKTTNNVLEKTEFDVSLIKPRNDHVLIRVINVGKSPGGVFVPDRTREGQQFEVVAIGPKVKDLEPGDKVLMIGQVNVNYIFLPNTSDLLVIKEESVVLVFGEEE